MDSSKYGGYIYFDWLIVQLIDWLLHCRACGPLPPRPPQGKTAAAKVFQPYPEDFPKPKPPQYLGANMYGLIHNQQRQNYAMHKLLTSLQAYFARQTVKEVCVRGARARARVRACVRAFVLNAFTPQNRPDIKSIRTWPRSVRADRSLMREIFIVAHFARCEPYSPLLTYRACFLDWIWTGQILHSTSEGQVRIYCRWSIWSVWRVIVFISLRLCLYELCSSLRRVYKKNARVQYWVRVWVYGSICPVSVLFCQQLFFQGVFG